MTLVLVILIFVICLVSGCLAALLYANDFSLPELDLTKYKRTGKPLTIVAVFPHPDDETMGTGGTLAKYAAMPDTRVVILDVTRGEQGETQDLCTQAELAGVRAKELEAAAAALGVPEVINWDYPDSGLDKHMDELERRLAEELQRLQPDVLLTFDTSGLYGHPDHIALSLVVQKIVRAQFPATKLLFTTLPAKLLKNIKLPDTITLQDRVIALDHSTLQRSQPEYRSSFWKFGGRKINAIRAHRTQNLAKHMPIALSVYRFIGWVEYFSED